MAYAIDVRIPAEAIDLFTWDGPALESLGYKSSRFEINAERRGITGVKRKLAEADVASPSDSKKSKKIALPVATGKKGSKKKAVKPEKEKKEEKE